MSRQANVHEINVRVGEQVIELVVPFDSAQVHHLAARAEVALDRAPIARELLRIPAVEGGHGRPAESPGGKVVDHAHKADPYDPNSDHFCNSLFSSCSG